MKVVFLPILKATVTGFPEAWSTKTSPYCWTTNWPVFDHKLSCNLLSEDSSPKQLSSNIIPNIWNPVASQDSGRTLVGALVDVTSDFSVCLHLHLIRLPSSQLIKLNSSTVGLVDHQASICWTYLAIWNPIKRCSESQWLGALPTVTKITRSYCQSRRFVFIDEQKLFPVSTADTVSQTQAIAKQA